MTKPAAPLLVATIALLPACSDSAATGGPMVYVALDQQFSEPINDFIQVSIMLPFFVAGHHNIILHKE